MYDTFHSLNNIQTEVFQEYNTYNLSEYFKVTRLTGLKKASKITSSLFFTSSKYEARISGAFYKLFLK